MISMRDNSNVELHPITREQWMELIGRFALAEREPTVRRTQRRYAVDGTARMALLSNTEHGLQTAVRTVPLLQISEEGIMVRSHADVPLDTVVGMQVWLGEDSFGLLGRVIHSTDTVGGYKVGIQLAFIEPDADAT